MSQRYYWAKAMVSPQGTFRVTHVNIDGGFKPLPGDLFKETLPTAEAVMSQFAAQGYILQGDLPNEDTKKQLANYPAGSSRNVLMAFKQQEETTDIDRLMEGIKTGQPTPQADPSMPSDKPLPTIPERPKIEQRLFKL